MRQFKLVPTSEVVDNIYDKHIVGKNKHGGENKFQRREDYSPLDQSSKGKQHCFNGKLSSYDVDMIRCLATVTTSKKHIKSYFGTTTDISKIVNHDVFSKHLSPFEEAIDGYRFWTNPILLNKFKEEHRDEIDEFLTYSYQLSIK